VASLGILGAGRVGTSLARSALQAGYSVHIAASGAAEKIALITEIMAPGATAMMAADVVASADLVVLAIPLHKFRSLDSDSLRGKVVVDAMNYWAPIDGTLDDFESTERTSSEIVAEYLAGARLVKSLNHIGYHELGEDSLPAGDPHRRAIAVASDDAAAAALVMELIDRLGYDAVDAGPLASGAAFEPGTAIFGSAHTASEISEELGQDLGVHVGPLEFERSA
jgi:8-hydroxy-5-deazaflavin:NADPH oxidoreductase